MEGIAIILVNHHGYDDTKECIDSILNDCSSVKRSIIVIDNGDINQSILLQKNYQDIVVFRTQNKGFSAANNLGMRYAFGRGYDNILLLNNDTEVENGFLDKMTIDYDGKSLVVPKILYYHARNIIWYDGGHVNKYTGNVYHDNYGKFDSNEGGTIRDCTFATGCCLLLSKNIVEKVGLFDDNYFMYCEDVDYCLRCLEASISIKYNSNVRIYHKVSASTGNPYTPFSSYYLTRNRLYYITEHKKSFSKCAFYFTIISRFIKIICCYLKGDINYRAYIEGIRDYKRARWGRNPNY